MPEAEAGGAAAWLDGKVFLAGGTAWVKGEKRFLCTTQIYSPGDDRWHRGPSLPAGMAYGPFASSPEGLEVFGGVGAAGVVKESLRLSSVDGEWTRSGTVPADVLLGAGAVVSGSAYLLGGCPDAADLTHCSDYVWRRDGAGQWKDVSRLPQGPSALHAVAAQGTDIYVFGGCSMHEGRVRNHKDAWVFDTLRLSWRHLPKLPQAMRGSTSVALENNKLLLLGGYVDAGFSKAAFVYDPKAQTYSTLPNLPVGLLGPAAFSSGKAIYVAGGEDAPRSRSSKLFRAELAR
jgi:N-acetylneuraminic acid mutarotase